MKDPTGSLPTECPDCHGWGETEDTAREMVRDRDTGVWRTTIMGYGCLRCGGTGQLGRVFIIVEEAASVPDAVWESVPGPPLREQP